ncbi:diguanylate cyclase [Actinoplanes sp. NPDC026623]|uniref:histidine kinase N-terminal 7TM domain-containing diguanylate cyclase n=1 Tax=Actinoplanes sp. NPDC026623 TaxID=3155610 RepID=UPI0034031448
MPVELYALVPLIGAGIAAVVGVLSWRRRSTTRAATGLALLMAGVAWWSALVAAGILIGGSPGARLYGLAIFPGAGLAVFGAFLLCRASADPGFRLSRRMVLLLSVEPVLASLAAATNDWHWRFMAEVGISPVSGLPAVVYGPGFWIHTLYCYGLIWWGLVVVWRARRGSAGLLRGQLTTVLIGAGLPTVFNVLTVLKVFGPQVPNYMSTAFLISGLIFWWALFRQGLMRLVPVARAVVVERISDAVVIVDDQHRILDLNPAACALARQLMPDLPAGIVGMRLPDVLELAAAVHHPAGPARGPVGEHYLAAVSAGRIEPRFRVGGRDVDFDIRFSSLTDQAGVVTGHAIVARDVTELNDSKRELARANATLAHQVDTLERVRAALAEQEVYLTDVLDSLQVAVTTCDTTGRIVHRNRTSRQWSPHTADAGYIVDVVRRDALIRADGSTASEGPLREVMQGATIERELIMTPPGGPSREVLFFSRPLRDISGAIVGAVCSSYDVTELNEGKRGLARANGELARANREQAAQLETLEQLRAHLAEQVIRDPLTALHNRRHLVAMMELEVAMAAAAQRRAETGTGPDPAAGTDQLSVVLLDIDHFKSVNDTHGHAVGDELLIATARELMAAARAGDTVARYGGEEFVVLLPGATMEQAKERAEQWRARCAAVSVPSANGPVRATFSAGVAGFPDCGTTPEELLRAADEALYAAKAAGRDRILLARKLVSSGTTPS